jgi:hypothetical protein
MFISEPYDGHVYFAERSYRAQASQHQDRPRNLRHILMRKVLLAGVATLSVFNASAAEPKEPPVIMPFWWREGSATPIRPGPGPTLLIAYKKVICKDVSFTMWIIWDYAVGQAVVKNGSPWEDDREHAKIDDAAAKAEVAAMRAAVYGKDKI